MQGIIRITEKDALGLIDTTTDFYAAFGKYLSGTFPVWDAHKCIPTINKLLRLSWGYRFLGYDSHPPNHFSFRTFPKHCVRGTLGEELHPAIRRGPYKDRDPRYGWFDLLVPKGTKRTIDAYSAFFDCEGNPVAGGILDTSLKARGVKRNFLGGNVGMYCVMDAVLHSLRLGYETYVIRNAVGQFEARGAQFAFREMELNGAHVIDSSQLEIG